MIDFLALVLAPPDRDGLASGGARLAGLKLLQRALDSSMRSRAPSHRSSERWGIFGQRRRQLPARVRSSQLLAASAPP